MLIESPGKILDFLFFPYIFTTMKNKSIFLSAVLASLLFVSCGSNTPVKTVVTAKDTTLTLTVATGNTGTKCDSIQKKVDTLLIKK